MEEVLRNVLTKYALELANAHIEIERLNLELQMLSQEAVEEEENAND